MTSEDCLVLKAFKDSSSLREAAQLLGCDPAGLARRVQAISNQYGFLQKTDNRWQLTAAGLALVAWTEASIQSQRKILAAKSALRIGTTMWFGEEVIIPNIAKLKLSETAGSSVNISVPEKGFERALLDGSVDFVIVCHPPETPDIEHRQLGDEEWVLVAPPSWNFKNQNVLEKLKKSPFIRHSSINTDVFLPELEEITDADMIIDNLIGIRSAVAAGHGWSIVPRILVRRYLADKRLIEVPYDLKVRDRKVCVWWLRNRYDMKRQASKVCAWIKDIC